MKKIIMILSLMVMTIFTGCQTVGESTVYDENIELGEFKTIEVNTEKVDFNISQADRDDVLIELHTFDNGAELDVEEDGDVLVISTVEKDNTQINVQNTGGPELIITIPEKYKDALTIESDSGDGVVKDLVLENIEVDMGSGDLILKDLDSKEVDVETEKGEVELEVLNSDFDGSIDIDTDDGKIEVHENGDKRKYEGRYIEDFGNEEKEIIIRTNGGDVEVR